MNKDIEDIKQMLSPTNQNKILNKLKDIDNELRVINDKLDDMNETMIIMKYKFQFILVLILVTKNKQPLIAE